MRDFLTFVPSLRWSHGATEGRRRQIFGVGQCTAPVLAFHDPLGI